MAREIGLRLLDARTRSRAELAEAMAKKFVPAEVITEELLAEVFGLRSRVIDDPVSDRPLIVPIGRCHARSDEN